MISTKSQTPNPREVPKTKSQRSAARHLVIATWDFPGVWGLGFGILRCYLLVVCTLLMCSFASCRRDMYNQPKGKPLAENSFFKNDAIARPLPPHTVARGEAREDSAFYTGLTSGTLVTQPPMKLTPQLLARGRERYEIYCAVCHGLTGEGNGEIVRRGFPAPPTYHVDRLRNAPIGHFYDVITNGYGVMYPYATRVAPADRWAISAYIRALQLSHNASSQDVPPNEQSKLEATQ